MQYKGIIALLLVFFSTNALGQANVDSLNLIIKPIVETEVANQLDWLEKIGTGSILTLTIYGVYLWFNGIRKKAEKVLEEQVEKQIQEKLSQVTGVKINTIAEYFKQYENDLKAKESAEIYMVLSPGIEISPIMDLLKRSGYKNFKSLRLDSPSPSNVPAGAIVILNNQLPIEGKNYVSDKEFDDYVSSFVDEVKLIYFGNGRYDGKFTHRMKNFANTEATLPDALLKVVRI